ncbi:HNH endonuclease [Geomesophilobacter sediminis]|uniref:HNH endonuclease n=1 Tax=Geomesophilobacter sediminis TaxID=2798584 RepID=A0A8J7SA01_9BACT|nr:HNH endonuclease [Geomesophilobacter sediminis]MBJ6727180.1 HNH endonuclease [Geomesophilobacter sediminis]
MNLPICLKQFAGLNRATGSVWTEATKKRAPHKPLLLLAVLDLVARGVVTSPFVDVDRDLLELNDLFNLYWRRVVPLGQSSSIAFPFSRLAREPFWELVPRQGDVVTDAVINNTSSVTYLRRHVLGARIEEGLFHVMQSAEGREALRDALLVFCFSTEMQVALREQSAINREAIDYSRKLEERSHLPLVKEILEEESYRPAVRDQGFRRLVVTSYDHRCAVCGIRIITPEQYTAVEAAHIVPWCRSKNDDIRNGMALCKLCHWAFDNGMVGVSENYGVIVSRQISADGNAPGFLLTLAGRTIVGPEDKRTWPAHEYLTKHRQEWRL